MIRTTTFAPRRLLVIGALAAFAAVAYGFAAANTVGPSNAGDGSGAVSGGEITNIHYIITTNQITGVEFDYTADSDDPGFVSATLVGPGVTDTCDEAPAGHWTCDDFAGQDIDTVTDLRVVSYD
jgi:hypothetical protein